MHLKYFLNKRKQVQLPIFPRVAETQLIVSYEWVNAGVERVPQLN